jgi:hypothetical protein
VPLIQPVPYIVIVEARDDNWNYDAFINELQGSPNWWHFISSAWIVIRSQTFGEMQDTLNRLISSKDYLLILPAVGPALGLLPLEAWVWLNQNLTQVSDSRYYAVAPPSANPQD